MISFLTSTALPIEAATTMGVSVKDGESIGKFGTGLKYAIAGILRLGGSVMAYIDGTSHEFTTKQSNIRGRDFQIVYCNGVACGFTTELGKHWQPWQLFRELASNTLDEGGSWTRDETTSDSARTVIQVRCRKVEESERNDQVFLGKRNALVESTCGATIYEGPNRHYYYRGIRAGSFGCVAPVTVDVCNGELSEDRLLDFDIVRRELAWAFRTATKFDEALLLSILPQRKPGEFWIDSIASYALSEVPTKLLAFLAHRPKYVQHPAFRDVLEAHLRKGRTGRWEPVKLTSRHNTLLAAGERLCQSVGVDPIPRERVHFTRDLGDDTLAVTCMDTRDVWFSTKLAMLGRDEFLSGYLEEAMHAMTGFNDCTRALQNALLAIIVSTAQNGPVMADAA